MGNVIKIDNDIKSINQITFILQKFGLNWQLKKEENEQDEQEEDEDYFLFFWNLFKILNDIEIIDEKEEIVFIKTINNCIHCLNIFSNKQYSLPSNMYYYMMIKISQLNLKWYH